MAEVNAGGNRKASDAEKELGNKAYKAKEFDKAVSHYDQAFQLDPKNFSALCNKASVFIEQNKIDEAVVVCNEVIEKGREVQADYILIARAYQRMGNAYFKQENYRDAVTAYAKSLTETRVNQQDVINKKREAEKLLKEQERLAYLDPGKALEEKEKGNKLFQDGKYADAIKQYTEAIMRNHEDAKIFGNRAACYIKLLEFRLALSDCNECVKLDPSFTKGWIRKGTTHLALKEFGPSRDAFEKALDRDSSSKDAIDGLRRIREQETPEERRKNAMKDPEVQNILSDPAMQLILQQMQTNPQSISEHIKNPEISGKILKLIDAGILGIR